MPPKSEHTETQPPAYESLPRFFFFSILKATEGYSNKILYICKANAHLLCLSAFYDANNYVKLLGRKLTLCCFRTVLISLGIFYESLTNMYLSFEEEEFRT